MFTAALFTIAKTWKQPKCPLTDEWIKKMWYTHIMEKYSVIKKNEIMPFAVTWMDLEIIILSEVSKTEERQISYDIPYMQTQEKMIQMNLFTKQKQTLRLRDQIYKLTVTSREGWEGGIEWEFGTDMYTLLYKIVNKDLLYSTGNSAQYSVTT